MSGPKCHCGHDADAHFRNSHGFSIVAGGCVYCSSGARSCGSDPKPRRFVVWARVSHSEHMVEMPAGATDDECADACQDALDVLIGNGDTGWNELDEDGNES